MPYAALYWPTKKIATVGGFAVGVCYLALSGGNVATERAFIMVAVMFGAILLGRRALTLRAVAVAALIVLVLRPEALTGPGFQMSFAATTALVAVFSALRDMPRILPKWSSPIVVVVVSSAVAGFATAPFAAVHFNQISHYGLIANLLAVPMMGTVVMPAAVLAVCLATFDLAWIGFWIMEQGLTWILFVAQSAASQPRAVSHVVTPAPVVLALLALGGLLIILW